MVATGSTKPADIFTSKWIVDHSTINFIAVVVAIAVTSIQNSLCKEINCLCPTDAVNSGT